MYYTTNSLDVEEKCISNASNDNTVYNFNNFTLTTRVNYIIIQHIACFLVTTLPKIEHYANDSGTGKTLTEDQNCHTLETMKGMKHPKDP